MLCGQISLFLTFICYQLGRGDRKKAVFMPRQICDYIAKMGSPTSLRRNWLLENDTKLEMGEKMVEMRHSGEAKK